MYNKNGDLVGAIPGKPISGGSSFTKNTDFLTDGDLKIERLATIADITANQSFVGKIARFGVIDRDIGSAACSKLATDLFNLYKV